jgi:hypothetical protein
MGIQGDPNRNFRDVKMSKRMNQLGVKNRNKEKISNDYFSNVEIQKTTFKERHEGTIKLLLFVLVILIVSGLFANFFLKNVML